MNKLFYLSVVAIIVLLGYQYSASQKRHVPDVANDTRWTLEKQRKDGGYYEEMSFYNEGEHEKPILIIEFFGDVKADFSTFSLQKDLSRELLAMGIIHSDDDYRLKLLPMLDRLKPGLLNSGADAVNIKLPVLETRYLLTRKTTAQ